MFWINGQEFPVETAELVAEVDEENRRVSFSLYIECKEPETGMSLSSVSGPGTSAAGLFARLSEDARDDWNDLTQSEVSVRGVMMRFRGCVVRLGSPRDGKIPVDLTATCYPYDASTESAAGKDQNLRVAGDVDYALDSGRL